MESAQASEPVKYLWYYTNLLTGASIKFVVKGMLDSILMFMIIYDATTCVIYHEVLHL